jgi:hypothetical protein
MKFDVLSIIYWVALLAWFIFGYIIELGSGMILSTAMTCLLVIFVVIGIKFFWQG